MFQSAIKYKEKTNVNKGPHPPFIVNLWGGKKRKKEGGGDGIIEEYKIELCL